MSLGRLQKEMIIRLKADDMSAFDQIYHLYKEKIFLFSFSIIKIRADAEEIIHDVFLKLWENRHKIDENSSFESFLFTITRYETLSLMRKKVSERKYLDYLIALQKSSQPHDLSKELEFAELVEKSEQIIEDLPTRQKQVYKSSRNEGYTYMEIAKSLNISEHTVETHMERALKTIRKKLLNLLPSIFILFSF